MIQRCKQCGDPFELTDSEIRYFQTRGLDLPKRCKACRKKNRSGTQAPPPVVTVKVSKPGSWWSPGKIAAAACAALLLTGGGIFAAYQAGKHNAEPERIIVEESLPETAAAETAPSTEPPAETAAAETVPSAEPPAEAVTEAPAPAETTQKVEVTYILNTYRKKFHKPGCHSVGEMNPKNRRTFCGTRDEAIADGYSPCHECNP